MKVKVRSPGSATVINAISTGCGSAFGIKLYVTVEAKLKSSERIFSTEKGLNTTLMEICVNKVQERFCKGWVSKSLHKVVIKLRKIEKYSKGFRIFV